VAAPNVAETKVRRVGPDGFIVQKGQKPCVGDNSSLLP
jgi:hypothetical protein